MVRANRDPRANRVRLVLRALKAIRGRPDLQEWRERKASKVSQGRKGQKGSKALLVRKAVKEIRDHLARRGQGYVLLDRIAARVHQIAI